jgi:hypothetical protein
MKKILILLTVVSCFKTAVYSQENKKDTTLYTRISLMYNPALTFRNLKANNDQSAILLKRNLDSIESMDIGYAFGLNVRHMFGKHFGINIGLNYSVFNEKTRNGSIDKFTNYKNTTSYYSVPLQVIYNTNFIKKINYYLIAGVTQNYLQKQEQKIYNNLRNEEHVFSTNYELKKSTLFWNAGIGVNFRLNRKCSFSTEILYNQSMGEINSSGDIKKKLFSLGPNFQFGYSF